MTFEDLWEHFLLSAPDAALIHMHWRRVEAHGGVHILPFVDTQGVRLAAVWGFCTQRISHEQCCEFWNETGYDFRATEQTP